STCFLMAGVCVFSEASTSLVALVTLVTVFGTTCTSLVPICAREIEREEQRRKRRNANRTRTARAGEDSRMTCTFCRRVSVPPLECLFSPAHESTQSIGNCTCSAGSPEQ